MVSDQFVAYLLMFATWWPLLNVFLLSIKKCRAWAVPCAAGAAVPALVVAMVANPDIQSIQAAGFLIGTNIGLDALGKVFLLFSAPLWLAAGFYAIKTISASDKTAFYHFFLLAMAGNFRLIVSEDVLGFYFGYALMSFAIYGLITPINKTAFSFASRVYIFFTVISELCVFGGLVMAAAATESTSFVLIREHLVGSDHSDVIVLLLFIGFGIKTGVIGLHFWLPLAYAAAPIPAAAVLAGAMAKAGLLGWIRILPVEGGFLENWGALFVAFGVLAAFYGVVIGLTQRSLKVILAYSSVSQLGLLTMAVGMALMNPFAGQQATLLIALYAAHHALNKGALFLGLGLANHSGALPRWTWLTLMIPALSLAGAPWTSGMLVKSLLKNQAYQQAEFLSVYLLPVLTVTSVATALIMIRFLYLSRPREKVPAVPFVMALPFLAILGFAQWMPWHFNPVLIEWSVAKIFNTIWPILIALVFAVLVFWLRLNERLPAIPPGDFVGWLAPVARSARRHVKRLFVSIGKAYLSLPLTSLRAEFAEGGSGVLGYMESKIRLWSVAMMLVLILSLVFMITLL